MSDWNLKTALKTKTRHLKTTANEAARVRAAIYAAVGIVVPEGGEYTAFIEYGADFENVARAWEKLEKARAAERKATAYVAALEFGKVAKTEYEYDVTPGNESEAFKDIGVISDTRIRAYGNFREFSEKDKATDKEKYDQVISAWEKFKAAHVACM